jgi:hypothetical protein
MFGDVKDRFHDLQLCNLQYVSYGMNLLFHTDGLAATQVNFRNALVDGNGV